MKILVWAAALAVALAGARLLAPSSVLAAATITGVPATIAWGNAVQGGSEVRVLVSSAVSITSGSPFIPLFGITRLCRDGTPCTANNDIINNTTSMRFAARNDGTATTCANPATTLSCVAPVCNGGAHNPVLDAMFVTFPATLGTGLSTGKPPGTNLCDPSNGNVAGGKTLVLRNFYVGVIVPAAKNSGTYTAVITFGVQ
jgi:hypothetical protein